MSPWNSSPDTYAHPKMKNVSKCYLELWIKKGASLEAPFCYCLYLLIKLLFTYSHSVEGTVYEDKGNYHEYDAERGF